MTTHLEVTEARLATLRQAIDGTLPVFLKPDAAELAVAEWIRLGNRMQWEPTEYGKAIAAVWIIDTHHELIAYTGPTDERISIGDAIPVGTAWQVYIRPEVYGTARDRDEARSVLWHMAAQALAAEVGAVR